jgi:glycosyltransferase involved in cell wall biosynthesis
MKFLLCHNFYQQFGGEDQSFLDDVALLRSHGHEVVEFTRHNNDIKRGNRIQVAARTVWNHAVYHELRSLIRRERPDIMHCTNIFPLISPAAYQAAHDEGVAVVQALGNYRLLCPSATLMRDGAVCESCLGKIFAWPAARHACYRKSRLGSTVVAAMLTIHRLKGTWGGVDRYYAPTQMARDVFVRAGMPANRMDVRPYMVHPDEGPGKGEGGYALFVGRLSPEKGIASLLDAWSELRENIPLRIIGDGPCRELVEQAAANDSRIMLLGHLPLEQVYQALRDATCLVMPSIWYETFGRTIIEAYAAGTPVVASRMGAMEELVSHNETGLLFAPGSSAALSQAVLKLWPRPDLAAMRLKARSEFENKYTSEQNYRSLMSICERTLGTRCYDQYKDASVIKTMRKPALYGSAHAS